MSKYFFVFIQFRIFFYLPIVWVWGLPSLWEKLKTHGKVTTTLLWKNVISFFSYELVMKMKIKVVPKKLLSLRIS